MSYLNLAFFIISVVSFGLFFVIANKFYQQKEGTNFSLINHFPYEMKILRDSATYKFNILLYLSLALVGASFITRAINAFNIFTIVEAFLSVVILVGVVALFYLPLARLKEHMTFMIVSLTFNIALIVFLIFEAVDNYRLDFAPNYLVIAIILFILLIPNLVSILNPNLFDLKNKRDETGNLVRPRFIYLAFSEWMIVFTFILSQASTLFLM